MKRIYCNTKQAGQLGPLTTNEISCKVFSALTSPEFIFVLGLLENPRDSKPHHKLLYSPANTGYQFHRSSYIDSETDGSLATSYSCRNRLFLFGGLLGRLGRKDVVLVGYPSGLQLLAPLLVSAQSSGYPLSLHTPPCIVLKC
jgi:hypothetical protein